MGEGAHPDARVAHQSAEPGGIQRVEPILHVGAGGHQPGFGGSLVGKQAILHCQGGDGPGNLAGAGGLVGDGHAAREGNGFLEPAGEQGAHQHGHDVTAARREAGNGDVVGVAAELGDVLLDPVQSLGDIQQGIVAGVIGTRLEGGQAVEAEQAQAVVQGDKDAVILHHQLAAQNLLGVAGLVVAAVDKDQHRPLIGVGGSVDIQLEAVLGADGAVAVLIGHLAGGGAILGLGPGGGVLRGAPAQIAHRGGAIGDAVPHQMVAVVLAQDGTVAGVPQGGDVGAQQAQAVLLRPGGGGAQAKAGGHGGGRRRF